MPIHDISWISDISNLKAVGITKTKIDDFSPIGKLEDIIVLGIGPNEFKDLSSLTELKNLSILEIVEPQLNDLSHIKYLVNLNFLSLGRAQLSLNVPFGLLLSVSDLTPLATLPNLIRFHISGTSVEDLSPLKHMTNLQLDASSTPQLIEQWRSFGNQVVDDIWADLRE